MSVFFHINKFMLDFINLSMLIVGGGRGVTWYKCACCVCVLSARRLMKCTT